MLLHISVAIVGSDSFVSCALKVSGSASKCAERAVACDLDFQASTSRVTLRHICTQCSEPKFATQVCILGMHAEELAVGFSCNVRSVKPAIALLVS